ncbi:hypothetical protein AAZV13_05G008250 [Glycine max]|uniref:uncharacterized protein n=1 Tax=Glycine max TaxID=3847 RepID=UPI0003DEA218|nr:uncharacterized protein LOC102663955 [Glycine max]
MPVPPRLLHTTRSLPRTPHILPSKNESLEAQVAFSFKSMSRILRKRELQEGNKNLKLILPWPKESQHHKLHLLMFHRTNSAACPALPVADLPKWADHARIDIPK